MIFGSGLVSLHSFIGQAYTYRPYQMLWVGLLCEIRPEQPAKCSSSLTGLHQQRVKGKIIGGPARLQQPFILPLYPWEIRMHLSLACLLACAAPRSRPTPSACGEGKGSKAVGTRLCPNLPDDRSRACKCGWAGRGNAGCEGQEWRHNGCTARTALLHYVGLLGRGTAQGRRKSHCKAAFWERLPPFLVHIRALTGRCIPVQPVSCPSTNQITALN